MQTQFDLLWQNFNECVDECVDDLLTSDAVLDCILDDITPNESEVSK